MKSQLEKLLLKFERLAQIIEPHSTLVRAWELKGGISAQVTALQIKRPDGQTQKMVLRRHGSVDLQHNPQIALDEYRLLQVLQSAGLAAPSPLFVDPSGELFSTPYIVISYIEGEAEFAPSDLPNFTRQLATQLSRIHGVDTLIHDLSFLPKQSMQMARRFGERPINGDETLHVGRIWDTMCSVWPLRGQNRAVLLHGDFWPGNILWYGGNLAAVIDWEDALIGDPLADLANGRLEILWAFGLDAMHSFTHYYSEAANIDFANLPYWDLYAALRHAEKSADWAAYETGEQTMRERHKLFTTQAFRKLSL